MPWRAPLGLSEDPIASAKGDEKDAKWLPMRRVHPNGTECAPNGPFGLNVVRVELGDREQASTGSAGTMVGT
ncbi:MAG: hypothetical protein OHK0048_05430 [Rhodoferax sp.]